MPVTTRQMAAAALSDDDTPPGTFPGPPEPARDSMSRLSSPAERATKTETEMAEPEFLPPARPKPGSRPPALAAPLSTLDPASGVIRTDASDSSPPVFIGLSAAFLGRLADYAYHPPIHHAVASAQSLLSGFSRAPQHPAPDSAAELAERDSAHAAELASRLAERDAAHAAELASRDAAHAADLQLLQNELREVNTFANDESTRATDTAKLLAEFRTLAAAAQAATPAAPAQASPQPFRDTAARVADPAPFSGNRADLQRFKFALGLSLASSERFSDDQHRLRYCFQLLQGEAFQVMMPFLAANGRISLDSSEAFLKELTRIFGDSNEVITASRELERLRQGNRDFSRYYADFVRLVATIGCDEVHQRYALERGLSPDLADRLCCQAVPPSESFADFVDRIKCLDDGVRRTRALHALAPARFPRTAAAAPAAASAAPAAAPNAPATADPRSQPRGPLTPDEKARRFEGGLCLYCGQAGHMANVCPNRHAGSGRASRTRELRVAAAAAASAPAPASAPTPAPAPVAASSTPIEPSGKGSA